MESKIIDTLDGEILAEGLSKGACKLMKAFLLARGYENILIIEKMETTKTIETKIGISFGNKKLPKRTAIFNLPAVKTCPNKTAFCAVNCYALKAERLYKAVYPARKRNLKASLSADFTDQMIGKLSSVAHKFDTVRIHEAGDFYNQEYFDKWVIIALAFPHKTFYAYTKSFHLDFSAKPENMVLIASFDESTNTASKINYELRRKYFANTFTIIRKEEANQYLAWQICGQDCTKCDVCFSRTGLDLKVVKH